MDTAEHRRGYWDLQEKQKALNYFNLALPLSRQVGDRAAEGLILDNIAEANSDLGEKQKALDYYARALQLARAVSSPSSQGLVLSNLMHYWQTNQRPGLAIFFGKQAVNQYQDLRNNIQELDKRAHGVSSVLLARRIEAWLTCWSRKAALPRPSRS